MAEDTGTAEKITIGMKLADGFAGLIGSWPFIIIQTIILVGWVAYNSSKLGPRFDPYPYILLNLMLSFQAAYSGPVIMMSQNRQGEKDRQEAHMDYEINKQTNENLKQLIELTKIQNEKTDSLLKMISQQGQTAVNLEKGILEVLERHLD